MDVPARFAQELRLVLAGGLRGGLGGLVDARPAPATARLLLLLSDLSIRPIGLLGRVKGPLPARTTPPPPHGSPLRVVVPDGLHGRPRRPALASVRVSKRKRLPLRPQPGEAPGGARLERLRDVTSRRVGGAGARAALTANNHEVARLMGWHVRKLEVTG